MRSPKPIERAAERVPSLRIVASIRLGRACQGGEGRVGPPRAHGSADQCERDPSSSQLEPRALKVLHAHLAIGDHLGYRWPKDRLAAVAGVECIGLPTEVMTGLGKIADKVLSIA